MTKPIIDKLIKNYQPKNSIDQAIVDEYYYLLDHPNKIPFGYRIELYFTEGTLTKLGYVPAKTSQQNSILLSKIESFGDSPLISDASFKEFYASSNERIEALDACVDFVKDLKNNLSPKGLFLYGNFRSGKTYLLSALAKEVVHINRSVCFFYVADLMRVFHSSMNDNSIEEKINILKSCDVLILDDLGSTKISSWFRDYCLNPIINARLILSKPTFFSANYSESKLSTILANSENETLIVHGLIFKIKELTQNILLDKINLK
jgi:primosomal protein DnaI